MGVIWTPFVAPVISAASVYAAKDALGAKNAFTNVGQKGVIMSLIVIDRDSEEDPFDILLFHTDIAGTADNAVFAPSDAELANCIGHISVVANDYIQFGTAVNSMVTLDNIGLPFDSFN